eukprot:10734053-Lingulodinium_polyedra.AAC.2
MSQQLCTIGPAYGVRRRGVAAQIEASGLENWGRGRMAGVSGQRFSMVLVSRAVDAAVPAGVAVAVPLQGSVAFECSSFMR